MAWAQGPPTDLLGLGTPQEEEEGAFLCRSDVMFALWTMATVFPALLGGCPARPPPDVGVGSPRHVQGMAVIIFSRSDRNQIAVDRGGEGGMFM